MYICDCDTILLHPFVDNRLRIKMTSENNSLLLNLQEVDKTTGEVVKLDVNSTSTVQQ